MPIVGRPYYAEVDGVEMVLCASCYMKLVRSGRAKPIKRGQPLKRASPPRTRTASSTTEYEIVEDYDERIRSARQAKGLTAKDLALKLRISESLLRKIEQGRLKPSIDLARRIERVLGVKLVAPMEEPEAIEDRRGEGEYPTLGDIVMIRRDEE